MVVVNTIATKEDFYENIGDKGISCSKLMEPK
jgi:hypothetical protein